MGLIDEVEPTLDATGTELEAIDAPLHADEAFHDGVQAHLDVVDVLSETVHLRIDALQYA